MSKYDLYIDYVGFDGSVKTIIQAYKVYACDIIKILKTIRIDECHRIKILPVKED